MAIDNYVLKTAASELPITLAEAKEWCVIEDDDDDVLVTALIGAATEIAEKLTNRVFVERTFTGFFQLLECSRFEKFPYIQVRRAPLKTVTSIEITINSAQEAFTDFEIKLGSAFSRLLFEDGVAVDNIAYPFEIEFVAGYGAAADVPSPIKAAIKVIVCYLYVNRGDCSPCDGISIPSSARAILNQYRIVNTFG